MEWDGEERKGGREEPGQGGAAAKLPWHRGSGGVGEHGMTGERSRQHGRAQ